MMGSNRCKHRYEVRSAGGIGKAARWEWSVYRVDPANPRLTDPVSALESGEVVGAQSQADKAGRAAVRRWDAMNPNNDVLSD